MSTVLWSVLVGLGTALHIFVIMMETGATQSGLKKKKIFVDCYCKIIYNSILQGNVFKSERRVS